MILNFLCFRRDWISNKLAFFKSLVSALFQTFWLVWILEIFVKKKGKTGKNFLNFFIFFMNNVKGEILLLII